MNYYTINPVCLSVLSVRGIVFIFVCLEYIGDAVGLQIHSFRLVREHTFWYDTHER